MGPRQRHIVFLERLAAQPQQQSQYQHQPCSNHQSDPQFYNPTLVQNSRQASPYNIAYSSNTNQANEEAYARGYANGVLEAQMYANNYNNNNNNGGNNRGPVGLLFWGVKKGVKYVAEEREKRKEAALGRERGDIGEQRMAGPERLEREERRERRESSERAELEEGGWAAPPAYGDVVAVGEKRV